MLDGKHICNNDPIYGDWRIENKNYFLDLKSVIPYLKYCNREMIKFDDIGWKGKNINFELNKERYDCCNIEIPCLITKGQNPYQLRYRMIDGRHRITKMVNMQFTETFFYILDYDTFINLLQPYS